VDLKIIHFGMAVKGMGMLGVSVRRIHRFCSCPKKPHYATFFDGAILQRSVHVFALVAATRLKAERCTTNG
jgi:hypothetical protein